MKFEQERYTIEEKTVGGRTIRFRAYRGLVYVEHPVDVTYQQMNLFVPEAYAQGGTINGYTAETAPVFVPNSVGGYMPGELEEPGEQRFAPGQPNALFGALERGYVAVAPALRGRTLRDGQGRYTGKAPACLVDYKAAVRYLRALSGKVPGDMERIITNGTSAGGALSSLMGSTGNHPDYAEDLSALGAAPTSDAVFAASCYCPITNLENADMAYEWQFDGVYDYRRMLWQEGKPPVEQQGTMTLEQQALSRELAACFPAYVNSLKLYDRSRLLTLNPDGTGSFRDALMDVVLQSAQRALDSGRDLSGEDWLTIRNGRAEEMDFAGYARAITRMKMAPAFDDLALNSPETDLFGNESIACRHFTGHGMKYSVQSAQRAEENVVRRMNPMAYLSDVQAQKAPHFRIRHGERDRDTSLAISLMLTLKLRQAGCTVDYASPWDVPHAGDYDLPELFDWIDGLCAQRKKR